ncbi:ATP-binding protein [Sphingomonas rosea]|uniref:histidine kinase n=1 Tax=Sphingomonas rosea TaxID=335605 RepID=A0ABP7U4W8_9SPHN
MDRPVLAATSPLSRPASRSKQQVVAENMRLLNQLRWIAVAGQIAAILFAAFVLEVQLPLVPMLAVAALLGLGNLLFVTTQRQTWIVPGELLLALLLDMAALTAQLYLSGGTNNPFVALYLLQIVLGAILLPPAFASFLLLVSIGAFIFLTFRHLPLDLTVPGPGGVDLRLLGEEIAFVMVAVLLVLFMVRIIDNLRRADRSVAELRQRAAEEDSIVRMGLFASGAAHELGTPLSSLSVLVGDWEHDPTFAADPRLQEELSDARRAVERCREIVSDILDSSGHTRGEAMGLVKASELLEGLIADWTLLHEDVPLGAEIEAARSARIPAEPALRQALWSLLENAGEASPHGVVMRTEVAGERLLVDILDFGPGFTSEQIARLGQAGQSPKGPGHGLGLFLAASVARRLGGELSARNRANGGAQVRLALPLVGAAS